MSSPAMIIRQLAARRGPRTLARSSILPPCRFSSTDATSSNNALPNTIPLSPESRFSDLFESPATDAIVPRDPASAASSQIPEIPDTRTVAEQYHQYKQQQALTGKLGSAITPHYQPHTLLNHPPSPADVTLELLLASEAHQGHATSLWNPANARYIHGIRQGVHIISLEVTAAHLRRAAKVVQEVSRRGGMVLFVGTRDGQDRAVVRAAELAKGYHLFERWIPGSITNGQQILGRCRTKVVNQNDEEIPGFEDQLYERPVLRPDLVVVLNPLENYVLLHECALNNIPTIGVIDTNADPTWVTYPIPANDDSLRCIQVIAGVLGRAGEAGQKKRFEAAARGEITYRPAQGLEIPGEEGQEQEAAKGRKPIVNEAEINKIIEFARKQDEADAAEEREKAIRGENID